MSTPSPPSIENAVRERYAEAAKQRIASLCCPVDYDDIHLAVLPREIVDRDYGCGNPSRHVREGETVLDLGSGSGKICYIASQVVGPRGRVIGIDMNQEMLALARKHREEIARRIGHNNVEFLEGRIQDLSLDLAAVRSRLEEHPVRTVFDLDAFEAWKTLQRQTAPLIADGSIDVVVSNCVLNLVPQEQKHELFSEIHRVLRRGGRAVISDIVCDEPVPRDLQADPELWSGCLSGAFVEHAFLEAFEEAGFYGVRILSRDAEPWQVVRGIEFRSVTIEAFRGKEGPCVERNQAVVYRGPWRTVTDDDGHTLRRGQRMAVCDKTFRIYTREPYAAEIEPVPPRAEVPAENAGAFDCSRDAVRSPRQTKGDDYDETRTSDSPCCGPDSDCG